MISGAEWCPYCQRDFEFNVPDDVWTMNCPHCEKKNLLCDKCYTVNGKHLCGDCSYEKYKKGNEMTNEMTKSKND